MTQILRMVESTKIVQALAPQIPSGSTPDRVSLKDYGRATILISAKNGAGVTGSDIALEQSLDVAGGSAKALAFDKVWLNNDTVADDALVETPVVSDTFTLDNTDSKNLLAVLEINAESLDADNDFDVLSVTTGDATNQDLDVVYILHDSRYAESTPPSAIVD